MSARHANPTRVSPTIRAAVLAGGVALAAGALSGCASSRLIGGVPGPAWGDPATALNGPGTNGVAIVTVMLADGSVVAADPVAASAAFETGVVPPPSAGTRFAIVEVP